MQPKPPTNYLTGYPPSLVAQVQQLMTQGRLAEWLLRKYPQAHAVRTDKALYDYAQALKASFLRNAPPLSKVAFNGKLQSIHSVLGQHASISRIQGTQLKAKREILVATVFREMPPEFLRMVVVHELAHLKERNHDKAFYQLCLHMEPGYHQLEFDLRTYLSHLEAGGQPLWR